jgi:hypothetical protein
MIDEVRDVETSKPVVSAVSGEVGEEWHGAMTESVHKNGFKNTFGVVHNPA